MERHGQKNGTKAITSISPYKIAGMFLAIFFPGHS